MFSLVVATDMHDGIARKGIIPWNLKGDLRYFRELTITPDHAEVETRYHLDLAFRERKVTTSEALLQGMGKSHILPKPSPDRRNGVIMGRKTWDSLPDAYRPLPNRINAVLTHNPEFSTEGTHTRFATLDEALQFFKEDITVAEVYVIGGANVYAEALSHRGCVRIYRTRIEHDFACDLHLAAIPSDFILTASSPDLIEEGIRYRFEMLEREVL